jgi:hypothetical protein
MVQPPTHEHCLLTRGAILCAGPQGERPPNPLDLSVDVYYPDRMTRQMTATEVKAKFSH